MVKQADISHSILWNIKKGNVSVSIEVYAIILHAINDTDKDLLFVTKDDELGGKSLDIELLKST